MSGLTLVLLLVALVVGVRLYSALGTRNKNYDEQRRSWRGLHERLRKATPRNASAKKKAAPQASAKPAPAAPKKRQGLKEMRAAFQALEPSFDLVRFHIRAENAYRLIVRLYAAGDLAKLRPLLMPSVYRDFRAAIAARSKAKQRLTTEILSLDTPTLQSMQLRGATARITLAFDSDMISALYDAKGKLLEGDSNQAMELRDVWCFERELGADDPSWRLAETETRPRPA